MSNQSSEYKNKSMPQDQVQAQRAEIKRLQGSVSKLTGQTETTSLKIEQ